MGTQKESAPLNCQITLLEKEVKKFLQVGYPRKVVTEAQKILLKRLKDKSLPPVKHISSYFQSLLVKVLWKEKKNSKNRDDFRKIKNLILMKSLEKQMREAGWSETEISEKIRKELGV